MKSFKILQESENCFYVIDDEGRRIHQTPHGLLSLAKDHLRACMGNPAWWREKMEFEVSKTDDASEEPFPLIFSVYPPTDKIFRILRESLTEFYVVDENGKKMSQEPHHGCPTNAIRQVRALMGNQMNANKEPTRIPKERLETFLMWTFPSGSPTPGRLAPVEKGSRWTVSSYSGEESSKVLLLCTRFEDPDRFHYISDILELQRQYPTAEWEWIGVGFETNRKNHERLFTEGYIRSYQILPCNARQLSDDTPVQVVASKTGKETTERFPRVISVHPPAEWLKVWRENEIIGGCSLVV